MIALVVIVVWAVVLLVAYGSGLGLRQSALASFGVLSTAVLVGTEALSLFEWVTRPSIVAMWLCTLAVPGVMLRGRVARGWVRVRSLDLRRVERGSGAGLVALTIVLLGTLAAATLYPSMNYDSFTCHLPRVTFWIQNHSVEPYPTAFGAQLFSGVVGAYWMLHLKLLSQSDRLLNLVQWVSYVHAVIGVSLIAEVLGSGRRGQVFAALAAAVTPMAILQASTTQSDLTTAVWVVGSAYLITRYVVARPPTSRGVLAWSAVTGTCIALAVQSKASAYLVLAPVLLLLAARAFRRDGLARSVLPAIVCVTVLLAMNSAGFARNLRLLDGDIIGSRAPGMSHILTRDRSPEALLTNAVKNSSQMLGTPSERINAAISSTVRSLVRVYGGDLENPATREPWAGQYAVVGRVLEHDVGPGPVAAVLALVASVIVIARRPANPVARSYALCVAAGGLLMVGMVTYNEYINRVLLGSMLLTAPLVGVSIESSRPRLRAAVVTVLCASVAWGTAVMCFNYTNRLVPLSLLPQYHGIEEAGFWNTPYDDLAVAVTMPYLRDGIEATTEAVRSSGADEIGILDTAGASPVYPLMRELPDMRFGYVGDTVLGDRIPNDYRPAVIVEFAPYPDGRGHELLADALLLHESRGEHLVLRVWEVAHE